MPAKQEGGGIQSAAGLIRYFDEEEAKGPKIDPRAVIGGAIVLMVAVEILKWKMPF